MSFASSKVNPDRQIESARLAAIVERWYLQSQARKIVLDRSLLNLGEGHKLDCQRLPRVAHCCRTLTGGFTWSEAVQVIKAGEGDKAGFSYKGIQTCGSWSSCPICSQKIAHKRRKEILSAVKGWDKGSVVMLTLTAPHFKGESLKEVRSRFMAARRSFREQRPLKRDKKFVPFRSLRTKYGIKGGISALEVTYSDENGWHFHSHELLFTCQDLEQQDLETFEVMCKLAWYRACERSGVKVSNRFAFFLHSCKVTLTDRKAADYLSKFGNWTSADELTRSHYKKGKLKSLTPWDFLRLAGDSVQSYKKYGFLFMEVVRAFFAKQQIFFEKGFRKKLGLGCMSDEEISELGLEVGESKVFGVLNYYFWRKVCAAELRGEIIAKCVAGESWGDIQDYLGVRFGLVKLDRW